MNRHQGFITIATYRRNHVDFLYGKPASGNDCYMTMHEYGPSIWGIANQKMPII